MVLLLIADNETVDMAERERINPENPGKYEWIYYNYNARDDQDMYGKWLVFKHFDELNAMWRKIIDAKQSGMLEGCIVLKTSTKVYRPGSYGPGPCTTGAVYVFTNKEQVLSVGERLCSLVEQDILYKTEKATEKGIYAGGAHNKPVTLYTMYYNAGHPTLTLVEGMQTCAGWSPDREDIWHLNVVCSPHYPKSEPCHGKWVLTLTKKDLTGVWHILKRDIEKNKNGVLRMICPPKVDRNPPVIQVDTTTEEWESVGRYLQKKLKRKIMYEFGDKRKVPVELEYKGETAS